MATIISAETQLTDLAIREEMAKFGFDVNVLDPPPVNETTPVIMWHHRCCLHPTTYLI
jgi:hypothetical protein